MAEKAVLFDTGLVVRTRAALAALVVADTSEHSLIERHRAGDWGELSKADKSSNRQALETGGRLFSAYVLRTGVKVWVITEADRSSTTLLLPSEY